MLAVGLAVRLAFTATTRGNPFDLDSLALVAHTLTHDPSHLYAVADPHGGALRWPYLTGYFPILAAVKGIASVTGIAFARLVRVPSAIADLAIAWVVQDFLRSQNAPASSCLGAAALIAFGPSFIAISGIHGQIDAVAILPATLALSAWQRCPVARRAWVAGLLIGVGIAVKTVPGLMILALLPSVRSRREGVVLVASAVAVPLLAIAPMLLTEGTGWLHDVSSYHGGEGLGDLGLVVQPDLPLSWFQFGGGAQSGLSRWLFHHGQEIAEVAIAAVALFVVRLHVRAPTAAVIVWLSAYVFGVGFYMQYIVWGLPFFLMAGYVRQVALLQTLLLAPLYVTYHGVGAAWRVTVLYTIPMLVVWGLFTFALGSEFRLVGRRMQRVRPTTS
jgi:hypothetical protein